ncbi:polymerase [Herbaspirillum sp. meg3]|uniref:DUF342 domain-containing protein n=1 Tax=Herbaspirillum sp. meg3 TaxID=2025949 RepID=UPI000B98B827|nr:FapA family protein [Herbaspirillum sp. meg3]ASU37684.1 polymerase [Herbaspirillum sp. meg3]
MGQQGVQSLSFTVDKISGALLAVFSPGAGRSDLTLAFVRQALHEGGHTRLCIDETELKNFVATAVSANESFSHKIGESRDGEFFLEIAPDRMSVHLTLIPPQGGRPKALEVINEIRTQGITHGLRHDALRGALNAGHCDRLLIAVGESPIEGRAASFESLIKEREEELAEIDEDAVVHFADLGHILLVDAGTPLMRRTPYIAGINGIDVTGLPVPAKPVPDIGFSNQCEGAEAHPDDPDLMVAAVAGQPKLIPNGVQVDPVVVVDHVDLSTGNIDFPGTVKVKGDIKSGMRLHAGGDVIVSGMIEAAEVISDGNILVKGGVVGLADMQNGSGGGSSARLCAAGSVQVLFAESTYITAGDKIVIAGNACQCDMRAGNAIIAGINNPKTGHIIGGQAKATMLIKAVRLGSPNGLATRIQVGLDPHEEEKLRAQEQQLQYKLDDLFAVIKQISYYRSNPEKAGNGLAQDADLKHRLMTEEVQALTVQHEAMKEQLVAAESARIVIGRAIHEGVELRVVRQVWQVLDDLGGGVVKLHAGKISLSDR